MMSIDADIAKPGTPVSYRTLRPLFPTSHYKWIQATGSIKERPQRTSYRTYGTDRMYRRQGNNAPAGGTDGSHQERTTRRALDKAPGGYSLPAQLWGRREDV